jgi:hypothetical protein
MHARLNCIVSSPYSKVPSQLSLRSCCHWKSLSSSVETLGSCISRFASGSARLYCHPTDPLPPLTWRATGGVLNIWTSSHVSFVSAFSFGNVCRLVAERLYVRQLVHTHEANSRTAKWIFMKFGTWEFEWSSVLVKIIQKRRAIYLKTYIHFYVYFELNSFLICCPRNVPEKKR